MELSKRLEACLQYTEGFMHLADIGTDHAMLPIEAVSRGFVLDAIAIDNKFGPYLQGRQNLKKHNLGGRVIMALGDGFEKITDETDVVVISGLGGELIRQILIDGNHRNLKRLVLQPNRDVDIVRETTMKLGYRIVDELVLLDKDKYYDIIVCECGQSKYSTVELRYGPINIRQKPYHFIQRIQNDLQRKTALLEQVTSTDRHEELRLEIKELEEILSERN